MAGRIVRIAPLVLVLACAGDPGAPELPGDAVSVMSFNIFNESSSPPEARGIPPWPERRELAVAAIRTVMPDFVGLQEALPSQVEFLLSALPEYAAVGRDRDGTGRGQTVSILYRADRHDLLQSSDFWFSDTPSVPGSRWEGMSTARMVTWARVRHRDSGRAMYVYNTHLNPGAEAAGAWRDASARILADSIAQRAHSADHFFLTGDFNARDTEFPILYLTGAIACTVAACPQPNAVNPVRMVDTWRARNTGSGGTQCSNTSTSDGTRLDYVFSWNPGPQPGTCPPGGGPCTPAVTAAESRRTGAACASDHLPVWATLVFPRPR